MNYAKLLRESRDKSAVAYGEFMNSTRKFPEHLFCFFEGKDNDYYVPRIKVYAPKFYPIGCGGRQKVLEVHALISGKSEYEKYKKAFFIDRDFNPPPSEQTPPIFETPCYSVENLYVSKTVFKEILANVLHLSESQDADFAVCEGLFEKLQEEFHAATMLFNAWYACLIDAKRLKNLKTANAQLSDKLPKGFIKISLAGVEQHYDLEKILEIFPDSERVSQDEIEQKIIEFGASEQHRVFRGKYELQFVIKLLQLILSDAKNENRYLKNKITFLSGDGSGINNAMALNLFSAYAETPERLNEYLQEVS